MAEEYLTDEDKAFLGLGPAPAPANKREPNRGLWGSFIKAIRTPLVPDEWYDTPGELISEQLEKRTSPTGRQGLGQRAANAALEAGAHNPIGFEADARAILKKKGYTSDQINAMEKRLFKQRAKEREADPVYRVGDLGGTIARGASELGGAVVGGFDPTYALAPGSSPLARILSQMGINFGQDVTAQSVEKKRSIRKEYDPLQGGLAASTGVAVQGTGEVVRRARANRAISKGTDGTNLNLAEDIGEKFGRVTSTVRSPERNKKVGGAKNSFHLSGRAIDIARGKGVTHKQIEAAYRRAGYNIVESLDEGDHSHFAFNFKGGKPSKPELATNNGEEIVDFSKFTPEQLAENNRQIDELLANLKRQAQEENTLADDILRQADDTNVVDISDRFIDPEVRKLMEPVYDTPRVEDVLTPAERQEMDASVSPEEMWRIRQQHPTSTTPFDAIGKGTVATTPVNDLTAPKSSGPLQVLKDIIDDERGSYRPYGPFGRSSGPDKSTNPRPAYLDTLLESLKSAKKAGPEQRKAYRDERKKRVAEVYKRRKFTEGEAGLHAEKAALKGELPRVDIEPIRSKMTPDDIDAIRKELKYSKKLSVLESINARDAFEGLLDGRLPMKSEQALLYRVYPELVKEILGKRPWSEKAKELLLRGYETSRAQMGSGDVSFGGRQGLAMISRPEYWKATAGEFKALSPSRGDEILSEQTERIVQSPHYGRAKEAGLHLMDLGDHGSREEFAPHGLVEEIPILGEIPKASNRAYTYMANELRFGVFSNLLDKYDRLGKDIDDPDFLHALGEYINTFTGRGQFGKGHVGNLLNKALPGASLLFFAPRFVLSTFQKLNPLMWARLAKHPAIAKEALRDASAQFGVLFGLLGLANQAGYEVEWDPRSPTGLKIKHGSTTWDFGGGAVQTISFLSKMMTNTKISGKGKESNLRDAKFGEDTNSDVVKQFIRTKLHPTLGYLWDAKEGENVVGQKFDKVKDTLELFFPLFSTAMIEHIKENGVEGAFAIPAVAWGAGVSNYTPPEKEPELVSDEEFLNGATEESVNTDELSAEDKEFLGF